MLRAAILWVGAVVLVVVAACGDSSGTDVPEVAPTTPAATKPASTPTPKPPPPTSTPAPPEPAPTATQPAPAATSCPRAGRIGGRSRGWRPCSGLRARFRLRVRHVAGVLPGRKERGGGLLPGLLVTRLSWAARRADKGVRGDTGAGCGGPGDQRRRPERSGEGRTGAEHTIPGPV